MYKLDAVIEDVNIVTIGIFSTKSNALLNKKIWENFDVKIECYITKIILNEVNYNIFKELKIIHLEEEIRDIKIKSILKKPTN